METAKYALDQKMKSLRFNHVAMQLLASNVVKLSLERLILNVHSVEMRLIGFKRYSCNFEMFNNICIY